jgi:GNAT superfamily N-acetyltransferase
MKAVEDGLVVAEVHTNGQDRAATRSSGSTRKLRMRAIAMKPYSIRGAKREEQRALTRLIVRATLHSGYDDAFIDRARPGLTISLNGIVTGNVQVAEQSGEVIGVVEVLSTVLQGIPVLGIFVDPAHWKKGVGRALFETAIARARTLKVGALMIYASPFAEGFYCRLGAIRIGEGPFVYSPEVILSHFLFIVPPAGGFVADKNSN